MSKTLDEHAEEVAKMRGFPDDMVTDAIAAYDAERAAREGCETAIGRLLLRVRELEAERDKAIEQVQARDAERRDMAGLYAAACRGHAVAEAHLAETRAQLARLREAAAGISLVLVDGLPCIRGGAALDAAVSEPGPTLASIRAEALRDAARLLDTRDAWHGGCEDIDRVPDWLRGRADEIEKEAGRE